MARERKDVSSLDSGVPLLLVKTKLKEKRTRGGGWALQGGGERRETEEGSRESKKSGGATDNKAVCSMTET